MCKQAEELAARGLNRDQIADVLGFHRATLFEKQKEYPDFYDAIKRGCSKGVDKVANALYEGAMGGNTTAQIFYLKNRAPKDWQDRRDLTHAGPDGGPVKIDKIERAVVDGNAKD